MLDTLSNILHCPVFIPSVLLNYNQPGLNGINGRI